MRLRILTRLFAALAMIAVPTGANAARVSPMIVELEPAGRASVARIEVTNEANRDMPFEVRMMRGEISEDGELSLVPADENFLVFPAQAILEAESQQVFRVQFVGEPTMDLSEVYYMSIQQVPVEIEGAENQVQVVVNYNVLVNVVPDGSAPFADIKDVVPFADENGTGIEVRVANTGTRYFMAGMADWSIDGRASDGSDYSARFNEGSMSRVIGVGLVAPGKVRKFFVPTDKVLEAGSVKVKVSP